MVRLLEVRDLEMPATVLCLLLLIDRCCCGAEPAFRLSKDHDTVFRMETRISTHYFHFQKSGQYREVAREHRGVHEWDHGTWAQHADGQIELRSADKTEDLRVGPFHVHFHKVQSLRTLQTLEEDIARFLLSANKEAYSREEIQRTWNYEYRAFPEGKSVMLSPVEVDPKIATVTKNQLRELLEAWKTHVRKNPWTRFHLVPIQYRNLVLLSSSDHPSVPKSAERVKEAGDLPDGKASLLAWVYLLTDTDDSLKEMGTSHPFVYVPELNRQCPTK